MFSWICARCGKDNPPSATTCVNCGAPFDQAAPAPSVVRPTAKPVVRGGVPTWLLTILFCLAIVGICSAIYLGINYFNSRKQATSTGLDPAANVARTKVTNPIQKYVEVVGIRLVESSKRKPEARFVVVNHSSNAFDNLSATVTIWASTQRSEEDSAGTFRFKLPTLGAYESREVTAPFDTKMKPYEFPDWQNVNPDVEITSP